MECENKLPTLTLSVQLSGSTEVGLLGLEISKEVEKKEKEEVELWSFFLKRKRGRRRERTLVKAPV